MSAMADKIGRYLESRARESGEERFVFYNDLAALFKLPEVDERWQQHPLCGIFDELDYEDNQKNRPFRTALVVSRAKNIPGPGFFKTVSLLRKPTPKLNTYFERMKFLGNELQALEKYYAKKNPSL
jgi:hypothetical protein